MARKCTLKVESSGTHHFLYLPAGDVLHIRKDDGEEFTIDIGAPAPYGSWPQVVNITFRGDRIPSIEHQTLNSLTIRPRLNS